MLKISNVTKLYDGEHGIRNISLHIPAGCIYGVIGSNGAGKTTLIKCIVGIHKWDNIGTKHIAPNGTV